MKKFKLNIPIVFFGKRCFILLCTTIFLIIGCESLVEVDIPSVSLMEKGLYFQMLLMPNWLSLDCTVKCEIIHIRFLEIVMVCQI